MRKPANIDEYIARFPADVQSRLDEMRSTINAAAPEAGETISYGMPALMFHGHLVFFAAFKRHIGFYALPTGHAAFKDELAEYKTRKGSVQFPFDQPLPVGLITRIVHFRVAEHLRRKGGKD